MRCVIFWCKWTSVQVIGQQVLVSNQSVTVGIKVDLGYHVFLICVTVLLVAFCENLIIILWCLWSCCKLMQLSFQNKIYNVVNWHQVLVSTLLFSEWKYEQFHNYSMAVNRSVKYIVKLSKAYSVEVQVLVWYFLCWISKLEAWGAFKVTQNHMFWAH